MASLAPCGEGRRVRARPWHPEHATRHPKACHPAMPPAIQNMPPAHPEASHPPAGPSPDVPFPIQQHNRADHLERAYDLDLDYMPAGCELNLRLVRGLPRHLADVFFRPGDPLLFF